MEATINFFNRFIPPQFGMMCGLLLVRIEVLILEPFYVVAFLLTLLLFCFPIEAVLTSPDLLLAPVVTQA